MAQRDVSTADGALCGAQSTPTTVSVPIPTRHSEFDAECHFKIFSDERQSSPPRRFALVVPSKDYDDTDNENFSNAPTFKFINKSIPEADTAGPVKRTPLADITPKTVSRPRSMSGLLARIASLEDELEQSKTQTEELKGDVVGYQDALHQADVDAGYF